MIFDELMLLKCDAAVGKGALNIKQAIYKAPKLLGALKGGFYQVQGAQYLVKYVNPQEALAEFLGSVIFCSILGVGLAPENSFMIAGEEVIIASKKIEKLSSSINWDIFYHNVEKMLLLDWFISHGDDHRYNVVYIDKEGRMYISLVDYSMSFQKEGALRILQESKKRIADFDAALLLKAAYDVLALDLTGIITHAYVKSLQFFAPEVAKPFYEKANELLSGHQQQLMQCVQQDEEFITCLAGIMEAGVIAHNV